MLCYVKFGISLCLSICVSFVIWETCSEFLSSVNLGQFSGSLKGVRHIVFSSVGRPDHIYPTELREAEFCISLSIWPPVSLSSTYGVWIGRISLMSLPHSSPCGMSDISYPIVGMSLPHKTSPAMVIEGRSRECWPSQSFSGAELSFLQQSLLFCYCPQKRQLLMILWLLKSISS